MSTSAFPALLGIQGDTARSLVGGGALFAPALLSRAQVTSRATALGPDDATQLVVLADVPRFQGSARRLLIEGQRTNLVADPRTPAGTGWTNTGLAGVTPIAGPPGADPAARLDEGTGGGAHSTVAATTASFVSGTSYAFSAILRAGTCATAQFVTAFALFGNAAFANFDLANGVPGTAGAAVTRHAMRSLGNGWWWCEMAVTASGSGAASPLNVSMTTSPSAARAQSYTGTSRTLDVGWCWTEAAPFASTPILPPPGSPGASTRGADLVAASLAALGIGGNGACTVLWSGMVPQAAPAGSDQMLFQLDDGTDGNRFRVRNLAGGATIVGGRVLAGTPADAAAAGSMTPGTPFRVGAAISGGRIAVSLDGAAVVAATGGPSSGLATLRLGSNAANGASLFGETLALRVLPRALDDAALAAAVAALPA